MKLLRNENKKKIMPKQEKTLPYSIYELPMHDLSTAIYG